MNRAVSITAFCDVMPLTPQHVHDASVKPVRTKSTENKDKQIEYIRIKKNANKKTLIKKNEYYRNECNLIRVSQKG